MKNILKIIIGITLLAICVYFIVSIQVKREVASNITIPDFIMELTDIRLRGWNKDKVNWEMKAAQAYYYDKNSLVLLGVKEGFFLDNDGNIQINEVNIATVDANIIKKEFVLRGVTLNIRSESEDKVVLNAENLKYFGGIFTSEKKYLLKSGDWQMTSGKMNFDTIKNTIEFSENIIIRKDKSSLQSQNGSYLPLINVINLSKDVKITHYILHKGKERKLIVVSDEANIFLKKNDPEFVFGKGMVFRFGDDVLEAGYGRYEPENKLMKMKDVMIRVNDGLEILDNINNKDIKGSIIKGKAVDIDFKEKKASLVGNVSYIRNQRKILSDSANYDVDKGMVFMSGGVSIIEGNKTIRSNDVIVDVKNDIIIAKGNVKTKLKI